MTIGTDVAQSGPYFPNGVVTSFPFGISISDPTDISVIWIAADGSETVISPASYTVTISGSEPGGTVVFGTAPSLPAVGSALWIVLDPEFEQQDRYSDEGPFNQSLLEGSLDRQARLSIWLKAREDRAVKAPRGEIGPILNPLSTLQGKALALEGTAIVGLDALSTIQAVANEVTENAANSAAAAERWAEGTLPGGAGTKSAREHAQDAGASALAAEALVGPVFASTAAGISGTANGGFFAVNNAGIVTIYLNDEGVAVAQREIATTATLADDGGAALIGKTGGGTVQDHISTITGNDGAASVNAKRAAASTVPATVKSLLETRVSVREWGAQGTSTASDHAKMQKAIDEAPLGSTLHFPGGTFFTTGLNVNRQINISCESGTLILGIGSDPNVDVINVKMPPSATVEGSANAMNFHNLRVETAVGFNARATLNLEAQEGVDAALLNFSFFGGRIAARDSQAGPAVRIAGLISQMHKFYSMDIVNQVLMTGCADANALIGCNIYGAKTGVVVDAVPGALNTLIRDNVITSRDGAVWVKGGSKVKIFDNQIEQFGVNGHPQNAHIILEALSYSLMGLEVRGNNFGGSATDVARSIAMLTSGGRTIEGAQIGFNTWGVTSAEDVRIFDGGVRYTEFDPLQQFRGPRAGVTFTTYPAVTANTVDALALLNINDNGTGTGFARKGALALGGPTNINLLNSWSCSASTFFRRIGGSVEFGGWADGPAAAQNSVTIGTLPLGFRPTVDEFFAVSGADLVTGAQVSGYVQILPNGSILCTRPASTNAVRIGLSPIRFVAKREGYEPGY